MAVRPLHGDGTGDQSNGGVVARPVARIALSVDRWDVLLVVGVVVLVTGVWLQWGTAVALMATGVLLIVGALLGARDTAVAAPDRGGGG